MAETVRPYRLLTPGPVPLSPQVLKELAKPLVHHRTPEFEKGLIEVWQGLKWFFQTSQPVMILTSTGSGAMEAALVNTLSVGDKVLALNAGKFGERWADMAKKFEAVVTRVDIPWGESVDLENLRQLLRAEKNYKAILVQAVETSTGIVNPIEAISKIVREESEALILVDAITGLGAMDLPFDQWKLDVVVAGSQKALMLPTGLSFIALSPRAWAKQKTANMPKYYFDLGKELQANQKNQTYFSSAGSHIVALKKVLEIFKERGLSQIIKRCERLASATRLGGEILGMKCFAKSPSASVTTLLLPPGIDGVRLRDHLESKYNVTVMGGQDQLVGKVLRIGHLGYITNDDLIGGFEGLAFSLRDLGSHSVNDALVEKLKSQLIEELQKGPDVYSTADH